MLEALARGCAFTMRSASPMSAACIRHSTGPKISSRATLMSGVTPLKRVGPSQWPRG